MFIFKKVDRLYLNGQNYITPIFPKIKFQTYKIPINYQQIFQVFTIKYILHVIDWSKF